MAALKPSRIALAAAVAIVVAVVAMSAGARHIDVSDPNDARGRLDIKRVEMDGTKWRPIWKVTTYSRWTNRQLYEHGFVLVFLDTFEDGDFDYYALVRSFEGQLRAALYRDRHPKRDLRVSSLDAWKRQGRSAWVRIPLRKMRLGRSRVTYSWYAQTLFSGNHCRRVCFDVAPNGDPVIEPRPDVTPTPSPPPSP